MHIQNETIWKTSDLFDCFKFVKTNFPLFLKNVLSWAHKNNTNDLNQIVYVWLWIFSDIGSYLSTQLIYEYILLVSFSNIVQRTK